MNHHDPNHEHHRHSHEGEPPASSSLRDPVCGMSVDENSKHRVELERETYYFCSAGCRSKFAADPSKYLEPKREDAKATSSEIRAP